MTASDPADLESEAVAIPVSYASVGDLAEALKRASAAHGEHEKRHGGEYDENWPAWYAAYMVAERTGSELPE